MTTACDELDILPLQEVVVVDDGACLPPTAEEISVRTSTGLNPVVAQDNLTCSIESLEAENAFLRSELELASELVIALKADLVKVHELLDMTANTALETSIIQSIIGLHEIAGSTDASAIITPSTLKLTHSSHFSGQTENTAAQGPTKNSILGPETETDEADVEDCIIRKLSTDSGVQIVVEEKSDVSGTDTFNGSVQSRGDDKRSELIDDDDLGVAWLHEQADTFAPPTRPATPQYQEAVTQEEDQEDEDDQDDDGDDYVPISWEERQKQREAMVAGDIKCRPGWEFDTSTLADIRETHPAILGDFRQHLGRSY